MKLEELRKLRKGTKLMLHLGNGWYKAVCYQNLVQVTSFGRKHFEASIEYKDARGCIEHTYVNPRRLSMV